LTDHNIGAGIILENTLGARMNNFWDGVKAIIKKNSRILVLVKPDGILDLPGGVLKTGRLCNPHCNARLMKKPV
jgi:hypothetical protein